MVAAGLQFMPQRRSEPGKGRHLGATLPRDLRGWTGKDLRLGTTEASSSAVEKTLGFDDVYYREFTSNGRTISLYVAYWGPGKMPLQLVASHTPDRCWVENGWSCEQMKHQVAVEGGDAVSAPGEWRIFSTPGGQKLTVLFWHKTGLGFYNYGERSNKLPSAWRWWRDAAMQAFRAPGEQYFVRLTSDCPFEALKNDPGWGQLLVGLRQIGLSSMRTTDSR